MPTITANRKVVEKIIGKRLSEEELVDRISYLGANVDAIDENEMTLEIEPNRPDILSEQGFGRALSSFIGNKTGLINYKTKKSNEKCFVSKGMENIRPYTACCIVKNLKLNDEKIKEIIQVQEKLHITFCRKRTKAAMGIYPCEKIKFPIYLKCDKPENIIFRPLEFPREINARQILSMHPTGREYAHLVEGLEKFAYFMDSDNQVLSFTPVINSHLTGKISDETKEAFIEVSGFDLNVCKMVLNILVTALADMGAEIYSMEVVYPENTITTPDLAPRKMKANISYINKRLGLNLKEKELKRLLEKMGFGYKDKTAYVPCYRPDVIHPIDLAEDVAIAYGYENFIPEIPNLATIGEESAFEVFKTKIANLLIGLNLTETSTYHITSKDIQTKLMNIDIHLVELANAMTVDYNVLRAWIIPSLMQVLKENKHNEYPQEIFDIDSVFKKNKKSETGIQEDTRLGVVSCSKDTDYTRIRQILDYLMNSIGLTYNITETEHKSFIPGRAGRVLAEGVKVAYIGEIHPEVLKNFDLDIPVSAFELNLSEIFKILNKKEDLFSKLDIRVAEIIDVIDHPESEKLYILKVSTGKEKKQLVAGLKKYYPERKKLIGKRILVLCNLNPGKFKGVSSEGMLLTAEDSEEVELIFTQAKSGERIIAEGIQPEEQFEEIDIDFFKRINMKIRKSRVFYEDMKVLAGKKQVKTKKVKEGEVT
ncbi:phenylalanine--tRNA ligase subunit beta [Candidatus Woesearchaeota archaeon]|nr:phenylalanine--tRNA ligase subunit beta [Candidatus Woesearchaeota archaeon]